MPSLPNRPTLSKVYIAIHRPVRQAEKDEAKPEWQAVASQLAINIYILARSSAKPNMSG